MSFKKSPIFKWQTNNHHLYLVAWKNKLEFQKGKEEDYLTRN